MSFMRAEDFYTFIERIAGTIRSSELVSGLSRVAHAVFGESSDDPIDLSILALVVVLATGGIVLLLARRQVKVIRDAEAVLSNTEALERVVAGMRESLSGPVFDDHHRRGKILDFEARRETQPQDGRAPARKKAAGF